MKEKVLYTERFIQFGEGGFLRGFADWMIQKMNEQAGFDASVVVVQPIERGMCDMLTAQNCQYTHLIRGEEGVECSQIDVISRCVKPYEDFDAYLALAAQKDNAVLVTGNARHYPPASFVVTPAEFAELLADA